MARRISVGTVGDPVLGTLRVNDFTLTPAEDNRNITLSPTGTGKVDTTTNIRLINNTGLELFETGTSSSNKVTLKAPASLAADPLFVFPGANGSAGNVLKTDGSGNTSWGAVTINVTDNNTDSGPYYPVMATSTASGSGVDASSFRTTDNSFEFVPSTGTLTVTALSATTVSGTNVGGTNGTYTGTVQAATLVETSSIALKENLNPITGALDKILSLSAFTYDRKDGSSKNEAGLIAEEVNNIIPNIVAKDEAGNPEAIQYSRLVAYLVESIKELKEEINSIRGK